MINLLKNYLSLKSFMHLMLPNYLVINCLLLTIFQISLAAQSNLDSGKSQKLRDYTIQLGIGLPVLFTVSAEVQTSEQFAYGVRYSRQWIKETGIKSFGTAVGITTSYFFAYYKQKYSWNFLPNRIRTDIAFLFPSSSHNISSDRKDELGLSWELLLGFESPYIGRAYYTDIGIFLMSVPGMKPFIGPVFKFGLAINL